MEGPEFAQVLTELLLLQERIQKRGGSLSKRSEDLSTAMRRLDRITDRAGAVLHALAGDASLEANGRPSSRSLEGGLDVKSLPAFLAIIGLVKADVVEAWRAAGIDVGE